MTLNSISQIVDMLETFKVMLLIDHDWGVGLLVAKNLNKVVRNLRGYSSDTQA